MRITVIATGFDAVNRPRPAVREELKQPGELEFGFDSANDDEDLFVDVKPEKKEPSLGELTDTSNDLDIPPFLRRKKNKGDFR